MKYSVVKEKELKKKKRGIPKSTLQILKKNNKKTGESKKGIQRAQTAAMEDLCYMENVSFLK